MSDTVDHIEERLADWGATRIRSTDEPGRDGAFAIDFYTPFPGTQPIPSSLSVVGDAVDEATVRYGVLDGDLFPRHPTDDDDQLDRLEQVAIRSGVFDVGQVAVNYGDTHREPRPHLIIGWLSSLIVENDAVLTNNDADRTYPVDATLDIIERFGANVRREFQGEWVEE